MEHNYKVKDATSFSIDLIVELVNNHKYLYYWLIGNEYKQNREAPLL